MIEWPDLGLWSWVWPLLIPETWRSLPKPAGSLGPQRGTVSHFSFVSRVCV